MTIGIALSGGGLRCVAQAGVLQALEEHNISIHQISGVSAGGIVGALYAGGIEPKEIKNIFAETPIFKLSHYTVTKPGLIDVEKFRSVLFEFLPGDDFSALQIPLYIAATDLQEAKIRFFQNGQLIKPLLASCALPFIFSPVEIEDRRYADGGILNNFPIEPLQEESEKIIGVYVNPVRYMDKKELNNSFKILLRSFHISTLSRSYHKFKLFDVVLNPPELNKHSMFSRKQISDIFDIGYQNAMKNMDQISRLTD